MCCTMYMTVLAFDMYVVLQQAYCTRLCDSASKEAYNVHISGSEVPSYSAIMYMYMYTVLYVYMAVSSRVRVDDNACTV